MASVNRFIGITILSVGTVALLLFSNYKLPLDVPSPPRTPAQELETFQIEDGLEIQLAAAEPMVQDPVAMTFDADGKLWVVEMRGYMPTINGEGEDKPTGRISVLEDTNADGKMDKSTVFLDQLVMPRAVALVKGGILYAANNALWFAADANNDLKPEKKILIDATYAKNALPEHTDNGLWRGIDNWYYNAKSRLRYKLDNDKWLRDSTEFRGQWGISHDNEGRLYYNYNWSQLHADLVPPNYINKNKNHIPTTGIDFGVATDRRVYPIRPTPAVNRGYITGTLDSAGRLREFTAAGAPFIYRSSALPAQYQGNAFVCEPAGNLIKRNVIEKKELAVKGYDPHPGKEFLASTDERFRPVWLATGPDGALYITDMYRGLIQHGAYVTPYLREQTINRNLLMPIHCGRIWRIVPKGWKPTKIQKLSKATTAELVNKLSAADGWQRDIAQRLLVERQDKQAIPMLIATIQHTTNQLARFHALWTLEGFRWNDSETLLKLSADKNYLVSNTALRMLEPMALANQSINASLATTLAALVPHATPEQALQIALSARVLAKKDAVPLLAAIASKYVAYPLVRDAVMSSLYNAEYELLQLLLTNKEWQEFNTDKSIFVEILTTAIIRKRDTKEIADLLKIIDVPALPHTWQQKAILTALAIQGKNRKNKPLALPTTPTLFVRTDFDKATQAQIESAAVLFEGVTSTNTNKTKIVLNDDDQRLFTVGRQHYLTVCAGCHGTDGAGINRFGPPLAESEWVLKDERRLVLLVLHGIEGSIDVAGKHYDAPDILPVMPAHATMDDAAITAVLTYIRNEWGNNAGGLTKGIVGKTRHTSQGRVVPWTVKELNQHITNIDGANK